MLVGWGLWILRGGVRSGDTDLVGAALSTVGLCLAMAQAIGQQRADHHQAWQQLADQSKAALRSLAEEIQRREAQSLRQLLGGKAALMNVRYRQVASPRNRWATRSQATSRDLSHVREFYRGIPSGRLVILGGPGAGKTVLGIELVTCLLADSRTDDPVPLRVSIAQWDLDTPLVQWLASELAERYPHLRGLAVHLIDRGSVLPFLDGLDEMDGSSGSAHPAQSRAARALAILNDTDMPMILTCRTRAYENLCALRQPGELWA